MRKQVEEPAGATMSVGLDQVESLLARLDLDLQGVRAAAARMILAELKVKSEPLSPWEKMHFEMAVALLPTVWLQLCLTHLRMALEPPPAEELERLEREQGERFESITLKKLLARLQVLGYDAS